MQKNDLLRKDDKILRVLEIKDDTALVVDCFRKSMPMKILCTDFEAFQICTEQDFFAETGNEIRKYDSLDQKSRRFVHEHFTMIAGILPFIGNERMRCAMIASIASEKGISKQTIRNYLWLYLVYQDIAALAPKQKTCGKAWNQDQKNMRWALKKFFYTKNSLTTAYTLMLKEKYCDASGKLLTEYPSIYQFRYFYKKHNKLQTYYISREGLKKYQRIIDLF